MEIGFESGRPAEVASDALIVPVAAGAPANALLDALDERLGGELRRLIDDAGFSGKPGATLVVPTLGRIPPRRLVLTGVGPDDRRTPEVVSRAWGAAALAARDAGARNVASALLGETGTSDRGAALTAAALGVRLALYRFTKHFGAGREQDRAERDVERLRFVADGADPRAAGFAIERANAIADAVSLARDLVNEPPSVLTPARMAEHAERVAAGAGLGVEVLDEGGLARLGANATLAVGGGSAHKPRLIRLRYRPDQGTSGQRVVGLVGKCITFDTGGYSIKTHEGMLEMKSDMAGGAAVLAAMSALGALGCPVPVEATIVAAENMISGDAFRPSDVLTALNGVTIEIASTDAEGRLVLADGLVDIARRGATELIDLATLTGAAVVALGEGTTALFASDDRLADAVLRAAARSGERTWRMPLIEELNEKIRGDVADVKNSGGRAGGAITAALFLKRFAGGLPWVHLDIAGSARLPKAGPKGPKGASGVGVRTLIDYLTENDSWRSVNGEDSGVIRSSS